MYDDKQLVCLICCKNKITNMYDNYKCSLLKYVCSVILCHIICYILSIVIFFFLLNLEFFMFEFTLFNSTMYDLMNLYYPD